MGALLSYRFFFNLITTDLYVTVVICITITYIENPNMHCSWFFIHILKNLRAKNLWYFPFSFFLPSLLKIQVLFGSFLGIISFQPEKLSYRVILIEMKSLCFPSLRISSFPLFLKDVFALYGILGWHFLFSPDFNDVVLMYFRLCGFW